MGPAESVQSHHRARRDDCEADVRVDPFSEIMAVGFIVPNITPAFTGTNGARCWNLRKSVLSNVSFVGEVVMESKSERKEEIEL